MPKEYDLFKKVHTLFSVVLLLTTTAKNALCFGVVIYREQSFYEPDLTPKLGHIKTEVRMVLVG
jgi:hypothetical protein